MQIPNSPVYISGRRGQRSIADVLIEILSPQNGVETEMSIKDLTKGCCDMLSQTISSSTVRSTLYRHKELFERVSKKASKPCLYRLTKKYCKE